MNDQMVFINITYIIGFLCLLGIGNIVLLFVISKRLRTPQRSEETIEKMKAVYSKKYPSVEKLKDDFIVIDTDKIECGRDWLNVYVLEDKGTKKQFIGTDQGGLAER
jgi:hypothetical protein